MWKRFRRTTPQGVQHLIVRACCFFKKGTSKDRFVSEKSIYYETQTNQCRYKEFEVNQSQILTSSKILRVFFLGYWLACAAVTPITCTRTAPRNLWMQSGMDALACTRCTRGSGMPVIRSHKNACCTRVHYIRYTSRSCGVLWNVEYKFYTFTIYAITI